MLLYRNRVSMFTCLKKNTTKQYAHVSIALLVYMMASCNLAFGGEEKIWRIQPLPSNKIQANLKSVGDAALFTDGVLADSPRFDKLEGAELLITFDQPANIENLALVRHGWNDWSAPERIKLQINGGTTKLVVLKGKRVTPGTSGDFNELDVVSLDAGKIRTIKVSIEKASGVNAWGTLELAKAVPAPMSIDLNLIGGVPANASGIELEFSADSDIAEAKLAAKAAQWFSESSWETAITHIAKGDNKIKIRWEELLCNEYPDQTLNPVHVKAIDLADVKGKNNITLRKWSFWSDGITDNKPAWKEIPPLSFAPGKDGWRMGIPENGFARFGWLTANGLLVGDISGNRFSVTALDEMGNSIQQTFTFDCGLANQIEWQRRSVNWTGVVERTLYNYAPTVTMKDAGKATGQFNRARLPQTLTYSSLVPGFLVDSYEKTFSIAAKGKTKSAPEIFVPTETGVKWVSLSQSFNGAMLSEGWFIIAGPDDKRIPLLIVPQHRPTKIAFRDGQIVLEYSDKMDRVAIGMPAGYQWWRSTDEKLAKNARLLASILRAYPRNSTMRFIDEKQSVLVQETFGHLVWANDWDELPLLVAPVSPLLSFAADEGYPVKFTPEKLTDSGITTKIGPYRFTSGSQVSYRLPVPSMDGLFFLRPAKSEFADYMGATLNTVPDNSKTWLTQNSLDGWWLKTPASLAITLMSPEQKIDFLKKWREVLDRNMRPALWYLRDEPFSHAKYMVSFGWKEENTCTLGDVNSGNGAAMYAPFAYARCSGDWDFVRQHWDMLQGALRYFLVEHDWAQMQTGAREHSGSSAIDMDGIGYEGAVAFAQMAEMLGKDDDAAIGRLLVARLAVSTNMRWLGMKWRAPKLDRNKWTALSAGMSEFGGFDVLHNNPAMADWFQSEFALSLSWVGQYPELYHAHVWGLGEKFWNWMEYTYIEKLTPDWRKDYPGNRNNHPANICANLYMRGWLGAKSSILERELKRQGDWGVRPPDWVGQENAATFSMMLGNDFPIKLLNWMPARIIKAEYDTDNKTAEMEFESDKPFELKLSLSVPVVSYSVNSKEIGKLPAGPCVKVELAGGKSVVQLKFAESDNKKN